MRSARRKDLQAETAPSSDPIEVDEAELEPLQQPAKLKASSPMYESMELPEPQEGSLLHKVMVIGKKPPPRTIHRAFVYSEKYAPLSRLHVLWGYDAAVGILKDLWAIDVSEQIAADMSWSKLEVASPELAHCSGR